MLKWITGFTYKIENIAAKAGFVYKVAHKYYHNVIQKEAALANITKKDHVLCIGGGICPFSAILFHQITGARVTVIDNNEHCIPKAKQVIDRLGLGEKVRVLHREGGSKDIVYADYSVVHLALQVFPMEQVFCAVEKQISPGTRLLVRQPKKSLRDMYSRFRHAVISTYIQHKFRNIGSTALYIKQDSAAA